VIKRLVTMARGLVSDPYVLGMVGLVCLGKSLDGMARHATEVTNQVREAQAVWVQMARATAVQAEANGFRVQPVPDVSGKDVASEREDVQP